MLHIALVTEAEQKSELKLTTDTIHILHPDRMWMVLDGGVCYKDFGESQLFYNNTTL